MKNARSWLLKQTVFARVEVLLLLFFFVSFVFGQLARITVFPGINLYPHDVIILLWLLLHLKLVYTILRDAAVWLTKHPLILATVVWVSLGLIWAQVQAVELRPLLILSRFTTYVLFAATLGEYFRPNRVLLRALLVLAGNIMLWFGLLQYLFLPDTRFLSILGWDDHYFRLIGPLFDPNFMGMLIILTSIFTLSIQWLVPKKVQFALQAYYAALLALTYSRASYATAVMVTFLLAAAPMPLKHWRLRERMALGIVMLAAFSLTLVIAPKPGGEGVMLMRTASITARQSTASHTLEQLKFDDLILGNGIFSNPLASLQAQTTTPEIPQHAQVPDNILLLLLSGTGVVGTILIISSLIYWIGQLARVETALAIALGSVVVHAQFNNTFFEPFISLFLLIALLSPLVIYIPSATPAKAFRKKAQTSR